MKAKILNIALIACALGLIACKPKATTEEKVSAEGDKVTEAVTEMIEVAADEVEPMPNEQAPAEVPAAETAPATNP